MYWDAENALVRRSGWQFDEVLGEIARHWGWNQNWDEWSYILQQAKAAKAFWGVNDKGKIIIKTNMKISSGNKKKTCNKVIKSNNPIYFRNCK